MKNKNKKYLIEQESELDEKIGKFRFHSDEAAFLYFKEKANEGDINSGYLLGKMYDDGRGTQQDLNEAMKWYKKAADILGDSKAQYSLASLLLQKPDSTQQDQQTALNYFYKAGQQCNELALFNLGIIHLMGGLGIKQDVDKSIQFLKLSGEKGYKDAYNNLGNIYKEGFGDIESDYEKAIQYYKLAADEMHLEAIYNLGIMYKDGHGVQQDQQKAFGLFLQAAEQGLDQAQLLVGTMLEEGVGTELNLQQAEKWYTLAVQQGVKEAVSRLDGLSIKLLNEEKKKFCCVKF